MKRSGMRVRRQGWRSHQESKNFFFEKKKQKTFGCLLAGQGGL
jgi:hypothetical protein